MYCRTKVRCDNCDCHFKLLMLKGKQIIIMITLIIKHYYRVIIIIISMQGIYHYTPKQTMCRGYVVPQLFCSYNLWHT